MRRISAVIIDDEASAIQSLKGMLDELCPMVTISGTATSVEQALAIVNQYRPHVVFLDIEMPPHSNGFDFLRKTEHLNFGVIFTTAYQHYAVQAINEFQPWAYLIKPYKVAELIQAVHVATLMSSQSGKPAPQQPRGVLLSDMRKGNVVVRYADLICCLTEGSLTVFYFYNDGKVENLAVYRSLREIESELPMQLFCRVHHGAIVNMACIRRYERIGRSGKVYLDADLTVEVSTQKMEHFSREFNLFLKGAALEETKKV
ncbi:MAG: response regulator transcription factor [Saprospiraceae bacterium]|jgi:two-component system LytT family response regulator|nr:response regulator transcription factor [Saprospiraceae bacterium]